MGDGDAELRDVGFLLRDDRIELRDLGREVTLLLLPEAEDVGLVLRAPAVEVLQVLVGDRLLEFRRLIVGRAFRDRKSARPLRFAAGEDAGAVDLERVLAAVWLVNLRMRVSPTGRRSSKAVKLIAVVEALTSLTVAPRDFTWARGSISISHSRGVSASAFSIAAAARR